jgi:ribosomal protein S18 acetylase RimI-like enzyme
LRRRDKPNARLATSNFQAPGFYERLGYSLYGKLENCPPGETAYYYWKELADVS